MESIFDTSQTMRTEEKRAYSYVLRRIKDITLDDFLQYYKHNAVELGKLQITWVTSFGEKNVCYSKSISAPFSSPNENFFTRLINTPCQLVIEEPVTITLRITNTTPNFFRLKFYVKETETKAIGINALSHQVAILLIQ